MKVSLAEKERFTVSEVEYTQPGGLLCPGCVAMLAIRYILKVLGPKTIVVIPAGCIPSAAMGISLVPPDFHAESGQTFRVPVMLCLFETTASSAAGIKLGLEAQGDYETIVLGYAGDGATLDIGIQALSGVAERNEDIIYVCYDNEAYMNTGIQRSSATPEDSWTTTTLGGKEGRKKNLVEIMAAHAIPYAATATPSFPIDLMRKVAKAKQLKGTKVLNILTPCSTGWRFAAHLSVKIGRAAVESKFFPLYEVENGEKYTITYEPKGIPVREYMEMQGRFSPVVKDSARLQSTQERVDLEWERLLAKVKASKR